MAFRIRVAEAVKPLTEEVISPRAFVFEVENNGERSAGINPYTETVTVTVASGDPMGEEGEFEEFMREALTEWFDGATVYTEKEHEEHRRREEEMFRDAQ